MDPNQRLLIKPLYLAKNIGHLQTLLCPIMISGPTFKEAGVPASLWECMVTRRLARLSPQIKQMSGPKTWLLVSQKLLTDAKESEIIGDQEKAYVSYFQYCEVASTIKRSPEYEKIKLYCDSMFSLKSVKDALDNLDKLTIVLQERYIEKAREEALRNVKTQFKGMKMQTSNQGQDNYYHNICKKLMNLELLEPARKKETKELQAEEESQNQIRKVLLKNSEDQVSKLQRQIANLQAEVESQNLIHKESLKVSEDQNLRLERQVQDLQDSIMCKICMDQKVSQFLSPCNHAVCCKSCIKSIKECPICRNTIENSHTIYFS